ncbi:MAG TPA: hypothetical protein VEA69_04210 [Tepidisphaeraceae bacterium]|nr:hypothetical protein [Tepidisphaeraceae bacterium]
MNVIDYSAARPRRRLRWFAWPTLLSAAMLAHFLVSAGIWAMYLGAWRDRWARGVLLPVLREALPAVAWCGMSAAALVLSLRGHPIARRGALFVPVSAIALFAIDVYFRRYQIAVFATVEYWEKGGRGHVYFTWWWFNDRWFGY